MNKILTYSVKFEKAEEGGYNAFVPILPGCMTQGDTLKEAKENIKDAITGYIEVLKAVNEPVPVESSTHISPKVKVPINTRGLTFA